MYIYMQILGDRAEKGADDTTVGAAAAAEDRRRGELWRPAGPRGTDISWGRIRIAFPGT